MAIISEALFEVKAVHILPKEKDVEIIDLDLQPVGGTEKVYSNRFTYYVLRSQLKDPYKLNPAALKGKVVKLRLEAEE